MNINRFYQITLIAVLTVLGFGCSDASQTSERQAESEKTTQKAKSTAVSVETSSEVDASMEKTIRATISEKLGPMPVFKILKSKLPNFYEVLSQGQVIYISADQKFLFPGPLLTLETGELVNLTQASMDILDRERAPARAKLIDGIAEENMVVFKAPEEKYVVSVFTDVDCPYCRRLHQAMSGYHDRGITVRYLAFPRAGVGSGAYNKLVSIWCAADRMIAMDEAKLNNKFDNKDCDNPIADQYSMTRDLGLTGTPAIILESGQVISGFMEPQRLLDHLEKNKG